MKYLTAIRTWLKSDLSKTQIIFFGACILSYTHTLNLFERSGYPGILAHIGTIICELMFFLGVTTQTPNARTRFALGFGGLIVLYSNVSFGLAKGKPIVYYVFPNGMELNEVILCGGLIPCLVWVSEWVGARVSKSHKRETQNETHTTTQERKSEPLTFSQIIKEALARRSRRSQKESEPHNPNNDSLSNSHKDSHEITHESHKSHKAQDELSEEEREKQLYEGMSIDEIIQEYERRNGKLPTIAKLEELANVSNWTARQALRPYRKVRDAS